MACDPFRHCFDMIQNAFNTLQTTAQRAFAFVTNMASSRADSKVSSPIHRPLKRQMVHLKTKEECRLGNETIRVWTVELPSKHAEGVLRCVRFHRTITHSVNISSQSHQGECRRSGLC